MKTVRLWVLVSLLSAVLVLSSCAKNESEAPAGPETSKIAPSATSQTLEPKPASFSVSGLTITPKEVTAGSSVTIEVLVTNSGELSGTYDVTLKIDETVETTEKVTLAGGASHKVTFTEAKFTAKTYSVSIDGQSGTFVVKMIPPSPVVPPPLPPLDAFMKGMHFWDWKSFDVPTAELGLYQPPMTDQSLKNLAATGANWIALFVNVGQETIASTKIFRNSPATATDSELLRVIDLAHSLGMRVLLLPNLSLSNDPDHWPGQIGSAFTTETQWQEWFVSYRDFINHYASFAQEAGVDMFSIGTELAGVTHREADWRRIIKEVRERFNGPIIYDSLGGWLPAGDCKRIKWWDAVDYVATDVWYPLSNKNDPTLAELKEAWTKKALADLENISRQFNKPFIISEIGYRSLDGTNKHPADYKILGTVDLQEQADCCQAALESLWGKPWLKGIFWFQWFANPKFGGPNNNGYTPYGKPAEEVLKKFYLSQ